MSPHHDATLAVALEAVVASFREAFEGAPPEEPTFLSDHSGRSGLLGTVADCDRPSATQPTRPGGPSLAGHVEHLVFALRLTQARLHGGPRATPAEWEASWRVPTLDDFGWDGLRRRFVDEYWRTCDVLAAILVDSGEGSADTCERRSPHDVTALAQVLRTVMWAAAHAAYHLGAMRDLFLRVQLSGHERRASRA